MEIPPEQREAAYEFLREFEQMEREEKARVRSDRYTIVSMVIVIVLNVAMVLVGSPVVRVINAAGAALIGMILGASLARMGDRREIFAHASILAEQTHTALALHELDEKEA